MIYYTLHPESWFLNRGFSIVVLNQNMFGKHVHKLCTLALMFTTFLGSKGQYVVNIFQGIYIYTYQANTNPTHSQFLAWVLIARDYFEEIEAIIKAEPAGWTVKNLCLWTEMVQRETPATAMGVAVDEKTVEEKEEELENAAFASLKAKIANLGVALFLMTAVVLMLCSGGS